MGDLRFQKPKVFDPSLADRQLQQQPNQSAKAQQLRDLGFDETHAMHEWEEKFREVSDQLEEARGQMAQMQQELQGVKESEVREKKKLQSFQQVNKSQSALVRAELQKCRRRLTHTQAIAARLRDQAHWFQAQSPTLVLPSHLQGLPTEEDAAEEAQELAQLHERWEKDIAQLLSDEVWGGASEGGKSSSAAPGNGALEVAKKRIQDLEAALRSSKTSNGDASAKVASSGDSVPSSELEAAQKESKDSAKKLKQLATAYKELDAKLKERDVQLAAARAEANKAPKTKPLPADMVNRIRSLIADERAKLAELRAAVTAEVTQNLPQIFQEVVQSKAYLLDNVIHEAAKEWKDKYAAECDKRRKLHNLVQELRGNIRVYCRVRPLMQDREKESCISFPSPAEISIRNESLGTKKTWQFNEVFDEVSTQEMVFESIRDLVVSMMDGYNVCIFAYGQTGAGKTHSMQGTAEQPGIYIRTFRHLFDVARERRDRRVQLKGSIVEIYNDEIKDLLADETRKKLQVRQGKEGRQVEVPGLTARPVTTPEEVQDLLDLGQRNRSVAATDMNSHSSRSHLLVQIHCHMTSNDGKQTYSCITLVDLAGSERLKQSGATGDRAKEAMHINKSLSALGDVINARATKNGHVPYRNSTLTHMLQDSLGGDSKTLMLLQINPSTEFVEESLCSLQFGARVNAVEMKKEK
mmetsp:Transcript_46414/g.110580  ORF Transcript_46414/g.110580 Transcript_46414/m.110580 type:complete len:695 (-) Transcript_46414:130-2214(-)|eukprot:CAMPEP_0178426614 /NCGR_PEP_ID=MMETSP0689_2-20121128/29324_1 /TAXON_ID=160604 /ORGANISM="Amphidinium massartii, Strain CS-259" /LENGTH=694 /DNA_ID=CAMNT_0020048303 /DNA_START=22 /DNA_END=2106 /DNA_ORIENTATION=+